MKRYAALETLFCKVDLSFAKHVLDEAFHPIGSPGRPPRNPLGIFKAHIVKRLKHIPSECWFAKCGKTRVSKRSVT
jgi:hypothetical protein